MSKENYSRLIACIISILICIFFILFISTNNAKYSDTKIFDENENRYLSSLPKISLKTIENGSASKDLENWFSDHFVFRNFFMNIKAESEKLLTKTEINNVYLSEDGFLIEKPKETDRLNKIGNIFCSFNEKIENAKVSIMLAPTAITIYKDKLPNNADTGEQLKYMNELYSLSKIKNKIDISDAFMKLKNQYDGSSDNTLYYRLDHHWTTLGAYFAYKEFCESNNMKPTELDSINKNKISDNFKGTIYSKVNDFSIKGEPMYAYYTNDKIRVKYVDIEGTFDTLFAPEYLEKKDKYSYFLNNLHSYVEIENMDIKSGKELAIIKDSYANCMIPMLIKHYKKIYVFDPRSYRESISEFINNNNIDEVLILYNLGTINNDTGIGGIR